MWITFEDSRPFFIAPNANLRIRRDGVIIVEYPKEKKA